MRSEVRGQIAEVATSYQPRPTRKPIVGIGWVRRQKRHRRNDQGSALLEFAISLPLLVVFLVGIYDFSGAFNQKQKIEHAAQEGAIVAAAQPMTDIETSNTNPDSLQPVVTAIFNSLAGSNLLPLANQGNCKAPVAGTLVSGVTWTYTISDCPDPLTITIDRGWVPFSPAAGSPVSVGTSVTVSYPYRWRFNSVIQVLLPGANYAATTSVSETATAQNQT